MCRPSEVCSASFLSLSGYTNVRRNNFRSNNCRPFCSRPRSNSSSVLLDFDRKQIGTPEQVTQRAMVLLAERSRVLFAMVSTFFIDIILPAPMWPGVDLTSDRNQYQEYFLGSKCGRCVGLTNLPTSYSECLAIWEPQTPGTLRASLDLKRGGFRRQ